MNLFKKMSSFVLKRVDRIIILLFVVFIGVSFIIWIFDHVIYSLLQVSSFVIANWFISIIIFTVIIFITLMLRIEEKSKNEGFRGEQKGFTKFILKAANLVASYFYKLRGLLFSITEPLTGIIVWVIFIGIIIYTIYLIYNHIIKPLVSIF